MYKLEPLSLVVVMEALKKSTRDGYLGWWVAKGTFSIAIEWNMEGMGG